MAKVPSGYYVGRSYRDKRDYEAQFRRNPNQKLPLPADVVAYWTQVAKRPRAYPCVLQILDDGKVIETQRIEDSDHLASLAAWHWEKSRHRTLDYEIVVPKPGVQKRNK